MRILYKKAKVIKAGKKEKRIKEKKYYVKDISADFHCNEGSVLKKDLKKKNGSKIKTNTGAEFVIFDAAFLDEFDKIERAPQLIPRKDVGLIITETGINRDSVVLDAGTGSGALCCFLAKIVKKVVSYEINEEHHEVAKRNKAKLGLKNLTLKMGDITAKVTEKNFDVVTLDLGNPWDALSNVDKALKVGGFLVSYSPTIPQVMDFVETVRGFDSLAIIKTIQIMGQEWEVKGRKVRPVSGSILHSGFMTFVRKIQ